MEILKIKTESIAHLSYLIIDGGQAAVIDPRRDSQLYVEKAKAKDAEIKYIFETHRNEDLVTGSRELERYTGAPIYHGRGLDFKFGDFVDDGQTFKLDDIVLKILETPGHTPESISIAVYPDEKLEKAVGVFTGDALFVDDVGRTDFFENQMEEYAGMLYDSIHDKLLPLGDQTILYPAHGAGSVCGGGIADREISTLGYEKAHNPRLQLSREKFIETKVNEKHQMPPYFKEMERVNLIGDDKPLQNYKELRLFSVDEFEKALSSHSVVDVRSVESFLGCHIPNSLSIPSSMVGAYAGYFLDYDSEIYLVADDFKAAKKVNTEFKRLGYNNVVGLLEGGVSAWETSGKPLQKVGMVDVHEFMDMKDKGEVSLLDVRKPSEWDEGIIDGARTIFLGDLINKEDEFSKDQSVIVYCGSGQRATIGASILLKKGLDKVSVFMGSMKAYKKATNE